MSSGPRRGAILGSLGALLSLSLAGCLGAVHDILDPLPGSGGFAPGTGYGSTTGAAEGLVYDMGFDGVPGARVRLDPSGPSTVTDADGYWRFTFVPPGRYRVVAEVADHVPASKPLTVEAARGTFAFLLVDLLPELRPRADAVPGAVYVGCGVGLVVVATTECAAADPGHEPAFPFRVGPGPSELVIAARWEPAQPGAGALRFTVTDGDGDPVTSWDAPANETVHRVGAQDLAEAAGDWRVSVAPAAFDPLVEGSAAGGLVVGQRVEVVVTVAYWDFALAPEYTGLAPRAGSGQ